MAKNNILSLVEIFNESIFRIPDFQRGYSWEESQLDDFWEDIILLKNGRTHYTGLITVEQLLKENVSEIEKWKEDLWLFDAGQKAYHVIDGQQRLTTMIILIKVILDTLDDNESISFKKKKDWVKKFLYVEHGLYTSFIFGYEKDNPSDEYYRTNILGQTSSSSDKYPETLYTNNLHNALIYFKDKVREIGSEKKQEVFTKVVNRLKFNFYEIDNDLDVYVTFETMNNRGKPLSNLELLKNRFIYLTTLVVDDKNKDYNQERLRKDINETWKTIYEYLGKNKDQILPDDEFLRNHWIMYYKYDRKEADAFSKFLLNKRFNAKNIFDKEAKYPLGFKEIKEYSDSLRESVKYWYLIHNPHDSSFNQEIVEWLQKFDRLGFSSFTPLLMSAMTKGYNNDALLDLLKAAEKFNFLIFRVTGRPSNTKNSHFYRLAHDMYWGNATINEVIDDINLNIYGDDKHDPWFSALDFQKNCRDRFQKDEGFYSWSGIRYFLYEYELHLQKESGGIQKVDWSDWVARKKDRSIEHIYPQSAKKRCWTIHFKFNKKNRDRLLNSLGNLVLISRSKNSELQNRCFKEKRKHLDRYGNHVGFFNGSFSEIEVAEVGRDEEWTPQKIQKRGRKMLRFLEKRWKVSLEDDNSLLNINDILGIDFDL